MITAWAPYSSIYNNGTGLTFNFTSTSGNLTFTTQPSVDPAGTLRFTSPAGSTGYANLQVAVSDPSGALLTSDPVNFTLFISPILHVDHSATGGTQDGTSWSNAFTSLQDALAAASDGLEIWVAAGTYYPDEGAKHTNNARGATFTLKSGVALYGGFAGNETLFSQRDPNPETNRTILSGDIDQNDGTYFSNSYHVVTASGTAITATTVLDGFTITAGNADGSFPENSGGGMYIDKASPTINNCSFQSNIAGRWGSFGGGGGAIYNNSSSPTINNASFKRNGAYYGDGGGIYNSSSSPTVTNTSFEGNVTNGSGGGIYNNYSSHIITNASFQGNRAGSNGGGICNNNSSPTITNSSFQGNKAYLEGGGIFNSSNFLLISSPIINTIIWNNSQNGSTSVQGASVANFNSSYQTYSHCLIENFTKTTLDGGDTTRNNLDGTLTSNNPLFVLEVDPLSAPISGGNLRLLNSSPAINAGDGSSGASANSTTTDILGNPRFLGPIDLGAYEGGAGDVSFTFLHPSLDPADDDNNNGLSNYADYSAGVDPTAPHDPSIQPSLVGNQLTFSFRNNAADVFVEFQKSNTLIPGSWTKIQASDYSSSTTISSNGRSLQTMTLTNSLPTTNPRLFFREEFRTAP